MESNNEATRYRIFIGSVSTVLLIASLFLPGFANNGNDGVEINDGFFLFALGWITILGGAWEAVFWLANPLIVIAIFRLFLNRSGVWQLSSIAMAVALSFLCLTDITASEAGGRADILWIGAGYWLWVSSMLVLAVGALYHRFVLLRK